MKIEKIEPSKNGESLLHFFHVNKEEARILYDVLTNAFMALPPNTIGLTQTKGRINGMRKELGYALGLFSKKKR